MNTEIIIKHVSDHEIWVGLNKTILIEDNIIHVIAEGPQSAETALAQTEMNKHFTAMINGKANYLIDLNKCGKNSPEARKIWKELSEGENMNKIALFGLHPVAKVLAAFVMSITLGTKLQFFKTMEEGLNWIKK